jgi:flavodoxin
MRRIRREVGWHACCRPGGVVATEGAEPRNESSMNLPGIRTFVSLIVLSIPIASQAEERTKPLDGAMEEDTLIVYLSRTGNTAAIAEIIHQAVGGEIVQIKLEEPYPEDYDAIVAQVDRENETGYLPPLETSIPDMQEYETVFVGFPTWDMQLPPPMKSFLNEYDLSGRRVVPFNTHGGYGTGSSFEQVRELAGESQVPEGFSMRGGLERDGIYLAIEGERREEAEARVRDWLRDLQML